MHPSDKDFCRAQTFLSSLLWSIFYSYMRPKNSIYICYINHYIIHKLNILIWSTWFFQQMVTFYASFWEGLCFASALTWTLLMDQAFSDGWADARPDEDGAHGLLVFCVLATELPWVILRLRSVPLEDSGVSAVEMVFSLCRTCCLSSCPANPRLHAPSDGPVLAFALGPWHLSAIWHCSSSAYYLDGPCWVLQLSGCWFNSALLLAGRRKQFLWLG